MRARLENKITRLYQEKSECSGCGACALTCPRKCISMQADSEGFLYPSIDHSKCINCNKCISVCPFNNQLDRVEPINTFAANAIDDNIRISSSSGGLFTLIAKQTIDANGVVFGALFDDKWDVVHHSIESEVGLSKLRGSKYVQSYLGDCYAQVKELLIAKRNVLFSGTPCQVAGLKQYLGKEYDGLVTVDFVCHGVPSPELWRWYRNKIELNHKRPITSINFRDKTNGWKAYSFSYDIKECGFQDRKYICYHRENPYMIAFLNNLSLRPSCSFCRIKAGKSHSDITLADFWNVDKVLQGIDDDKGTSLIMANTHTGALLLDSINDGRFMNVSFQEAIKYNHAWEESYPLNPYREKFYSSYKRHAKDFDAYVRSFLQDQLTWQKKVKRALKRLLTNAR